MTRCIVFRIVKSATCLGMSLLLLGLVLQTGCKRSTTVVGPKGEKATVTQDGGKVEVAYKNKEGGEVHFAGGTDAVALPEGFPKDVAIYPKAKVFMSTTADKGLTMMLMTKTPDSIQKAEAFYKSKMKEDGWKIENAMNISQQVMLQGKKEDRMLTVAISKESKETQIMVSVTKEKK